jgi:hypothetical protein
MSKEQESTWEDVTGSLLSLQGLVISGKMVCGAGRSSGKIYSAAEPLKTRRKIKWLS